MGLFDAAHDELLRSAGSDDTPLRTHEEHASNDFYGNASVLKRYAGLPRTASLAATVEHGVFYGDYVWEVDMDAPLPAVIAPSPARLDTLARHTPKATFAIGPMVHYAPPSLGPEELAAEKARLGSVLLAFPKHSCHWTQAIYDIDAFCHTLRRTGRDFDTVLVCLYWKDVLQGTARAFMERGFRCVTAGHMYSPYFLNRLRAIIEVADAGIANFFSSALGYCVHLGRPFRIAMQDMEFVTPDAAMQTHREHIFSTSSGSWEADIAEAFKGAPITITPHQRQLVDTMWGSAHVRDAATLRRILDLCAAMRTSGASVAASDCIAADMAALCMVEERPDDALLLLEGVLHRETPPARALATLAEAHLALGATERALDAARRLARSAPDDARLAGLLQRIATRTGASTVAP